MRAGEWVMLSVISGIAVAAAGIVTLWYCLPTDGKPAAIATKPIFDTLIPILIVSCLSIGAALIIAGLVGAA